MKALGSPQIWHNYREGNNVAHALAAAGSKEATTDVKTLMDPPLWIRRLLYLDKLGFSSSRKICNVDCTNL